MTPAKVKLILEKSETHWLVWDEGQRSKLDLKVFKTLKQASDYINNYLNLLIMETQP